MEEGVPIEHGMVTRAIANAQKKVEAHNFEIRKQLLEYDDVMNKQREVIYQHRHAVLAGQSFRDDIHDMMKHVDWRIDVYCPVEQYRKSGIQRSCRNDARPVRLWISRKGKMGRTLQGRRSRCAHRGNPEKFARSLRHKEQELDPSSCGFEKMLHAAGGRPPLERSSAGDGSSA